MTDRIATLLERLEYVSSVGARAVRMTSLGAAVAAVAAWAAIFLPGVGGFGTFALLVLLVPAGYLWWYARALERVVDTTAIEAKTRSFTDSLTEHGRTVRAAAEPGRLRLIRAAWAAVRAARKLRSDIDDLGFDVAGWAVLSNPLSLVAVAGSLVAAVLIGLVAVVVGGIRILV